MQALESELTEPATQPDWNPEEAALRAEVIAAIEAAILKLAPDQRLVIILSDIQGMSYEEIARVAGTPLGTVKSRIARARARLRELLLAQPELFPPVQRHDVREQ